MIRHHLEDDLLLAFAAGRMAGGPAVVVDAHLEGCDCCRARLRDLHAVGGALIDESEPQPLAPEAWARTLARIDSAAVQPARRQTASVLPDLPAGTPWPRSVQRCAVSRWVWMGPGMRFARLSLKSDPEAKLFLLRIGPGRSLPIHTHTGLELTQVLCGTFDDGRAVFGAGDFDAADEAVHHQPVVQAGSECVCLAYVGGRLRFDGRIAALVGGWVGM